MLPNIRESGRIVMIHDNQSGGVALRKSILLWAGLMSVSVSLWGCASASDIPDKKEAVIIDYMANVVLEHDKNIEYTIEETLITTLPPKVTVAPQKSEPPESTKDPVNSKEPDSQDGTKEPVESQEPSDITADNPAQVLGIKALGMKIKGYELHKNYSSGDYFTLEPEKGKRLLMVSIVLTNNSSKAKQVTLNANMVDYEIVLNDKDTYNPLMTVLDNDLLYLDKKIPAKESIEAILVFQVDEKTDISKVEFSMEKDKEKFAQTISKL